MYELVSAVTGIALYFLATRQSVCAASSLVILAALTGVFGVVAGGFIGAGRPGIAAVAPWLWTLTILAVGSAVAWGAIAATASIIAARGEHPSPGAEAVASAAIATIGLVAGRNVKVAERLGVKWMSMQILRVRYGNRFSVFDTSKPFDDPIRLAYQAVRDDSFSAPSGAVTGWGYSARRRRFELVAAADASHEGVNSHDPTSRRDREGGSGDSSSA